MQNKKIGQEHIHELLFGGEISWQTIIYDLINSEQLDPWDIDILQLSNKFFERIRALEEADFFVSSKVLFAAALFLRIKSEILLNEHIKSIDEILFGTHDEEKHSIEEFEFDEEVPMLIPKTPMPRFRRVTVKELIAALDKAMKTETRKIKRELIEKRAIQKSSLSLPKKRQSIGERVRAIYQNILLLIKKKERVSFSELAGERREEQIATFLPLLHLDNQKKIWLEQEGHFQEIWILLKRLFNEDSKEELRIEVDNKARELDEEQRARMEKINTDFENPLADFFNNF